MRRLKKLACRVIVFAKGSGRVSLPSRKKPFLGAPWGACYATRVSMRRFFAALVFASLVSCGRRANRADCEVVVDQNVEVQLRAMGVVDPSTVDKRKDEMRSALRDDIDKCVGRRVTDGMLGCVRRAQTAKQIDECLK